jgi:ATPase subunit of ABC transporter with duplicated ATPase domains
MGFVGVSELSYCHPGGDFLFIDVEFRVSDGEHIAFIGDNGVGKTTLFRILSGELAPETGAITCDGRILYMPQDVGFGSPDQTVREMLLDATPPALRMAGLRYLQAERAIEIGEPDAGSQLGEAIGEWSDLGGYQLEATWDASIQRIVGVSLSDVENRPATSLSGGERKQLLVDVVLSADADIVLLDEPDNYLDIPAKYWLEKQIRASKKTVLLISHDRDVLTNAVGKIVTLESNGCWTHHASYGDYRAAREQRQTRLAGNLQRWTEEERRLFRFYKIMKERAKLNSKNASKANAAETRWRKFVEAGPPAPPATSQQIKVRLRGGESARRVLKLHEIGIEMLVQPFSTEVRFGERVALVGPNGSGKTTLLRLLAGESLSYAGEIVWGNRVSPGLFTQVNSRSDFRSRVVLDITTERVGSEYDSMSALARYGLQGAARRSFESLSGGQKARLEILCLEAEGHNLLLLDEPTDNLDIDSAEALEAALNGFTGTVISVSHDRHFLRQLDRFLLLANDGRVFEIQDLETVLAALQHPDRIDAIRNVKLLTTESVVVADVPR